jgi:hypothetical protein
VILREEYRLRICVNELLRRMFGSKKDEMVKGWRKLHNEELHNTLTAHQIYLD